MNYLNPQINTADTRNTSSGNPYLDPEFIQHFEVNWSYSYKKRNINVNADYDFYNNVINAVQLVDVLTGVAHYTFANIGRKNSTGLNLTYSDVVGKKTNFSLNTRIAYEHLSGIADGIFYTNAGLTGNLNFNVRRTLPRAWWLHTNVTVRLGDLTLQGRENTWYRYQFSIGKSLLKNKKLQLTLTACQPFERWRTTSTQTENAYFYILSENIVPARYLQLTCNWRFGSLSSNVSRKRGTKSNDQKNISGN